MEVKINIDIEKILWDFLKGEWYERTLDEYIKYRTKDIINNKITSEVEKSLNIEWFTIEQENKIKGYYDDFFNKKVIEFLDNKVSIYLENYFNWKLENKWWWKSFIYTKIEKYIKEYMENNFLPKLQNILNNILVVNAEKMITEEDLECAYQNWASDFRESL